MQHRHEIAVGDEHVVAVHHEAPEEDWLLFCHGFQSDKSGSYEGRCERAVEEGYDAVRFDFRGCGESSREFDEQTLSSRIADLRAVLDYFDPSSCAVFGSSFGGTVAFHTAEDDRIDAIAARAPVTYGRAFDSYRSQAEVNTADEPGEDAPPGGWTDFFADLDKYSFEATADALSVPVAVFHGKADDSVAIEDSIEAVGALSVDTLFQAYAGEGHRFSRKAEARMREQFFDWLADCS